jgi:hypothetical protein
MPRVVPLQFATTAYPGWAKVTVCGTFTLSVVEVDDEVDVVVVCAPADTAVRRAQARSSEWSRPRGGWCDTKRIR